MQGHQELGCGAAGPEEGNALAEPRSKSGRQPGERRGAALAFMSHNSGVTVHGAHCDCFHLELRRPRVVCEQGWGSTPQGEGPASSEG